MFKNNLEYTSFVFAGGVIGVALRIVFYITYQHGIGGISALNFLLSFLAGCVVFGIVGVLD